MPKQLPLPSFNHPFLFSVWCSHSVKCDDCGTLGGRSTRDDRQYFICPSCARLFYSC